MKSFLYRFYAFLFNLSALLFPLKENRATFISMHNENFNDSLGEVMREFQSRGFDCVSITRRDLDVKLKNIPRVFGFFFRKSRLLASSKYVFLNDNFMPMAFLNFKKSAVVTQLWHAEGAFKRFGLSIKQPENVRKNEIAGNKRLSYVVCSSKSVVPIYAEAFGVREEQVLPLGAPRADYLLKEENKTKARTKIENLFPASKGKQILLYAPTFRDTKEENEKLLSNFDFELFKREFVDEYAVFVKLHPQVHESVSLPSFAFDVTEYDDVRELVLAADVLVTDYSSICMDFSLLSKKTVFFAFDEEKYTKERNFCFDYKTELPGKIAKTTEEVIELLRAEPDEEKNKKFRDKNFDFLDCESVKRVADAIIAKAQNKE